MTEGVSPDAMPSSTGGTRDCGVTRRRRPVKLVLLVVIPLVLVVATALGGDPLAAFDSSLVAVEVSPSDGRQSGER